MKTNLILIAIVAIAGYTFWTYTSSTLAEESCLNAGGRWNENEKRCSV